MFTRSLRWDGFVKTSIEPLPNVSVVMAPNTMGSIRLGARYSGEVQELPPSLEAKMVLELWKV